MKQDVEDDGIFYLHVLEIISIRMPLLLIKFCIYLKVVIQWHSDAEAGTVFVTATNSRAERQGGDSCEIIDHRHSQNQD